jgi:hypothetical protein
LDSKPSRQFVKNVSVQIFSGHEKICVAQSDAKVVKASKADAANTASASANNAFLDIAGLGV